jgi:D-alanine-D-alanine ligase
LPGCPIALNKAFHEDAQILVEEFIKGREFSIGVARLHGKITVLPATEILPLKIFLITKPNIHPA